MEDQIRKQVEFYFSDSNYPKDKFLRAQAAQNEEGYIPLDVLSTFQRLKKLTTEKTVIAEALKKSPENQSYELNPEGTMVKRKKPLPEEDITVARSIYSKGWPAGTSIDDIEATLTPFSKVLCVRIRKDLQKKPKNSAFIELSTEEDAKKFVANHNPLDYKGNPIISKMKNDYYLQKKEERKEKEAEKKRKAEESSGAQTGEKAAKKAKTEDKDDKKEGKQEGKKGKQEETFTPGLILAFKGVGDNTTRETIKETLAGYGDIAFVDFSRGGKEGFLRFAAAGSAVKTVEAIKEKKIAIGGVVPEVSVLEGDAEKEYWKKLNEQKQNKGKKGKKGKGKRRF